MEDRSFIVIGISGRDTAQGLLVRLRAVLVENCERFDVVAFPRHLRVERLCALERRRALLQLFGVWWRPDRVIPRARHAPPRHRASWVGFRRVLISQPRFFISE